jgi:DNA-binding GntR family transcriptional regulator
LARLWASLFQALKEHRAIVEAMRRLGAERTKRLMRATFTRASLPLGAKIEMPERVGVK